MKVSLNFFLCLSEYIKITMKKFSKYNNILVIYKLWMTDEAGRNILGEGRIKLLFLIAQNGSISSAAKEIGVSYRKAWGDLRTAEQLLGFALIERRRGGKSGGQTLLTEEGKILIESYQEMKIEFQQVVNEVIRKFKRKIKGC